MSPIANEQTNEWFKYIQTCMLLNGWSTVCDALNGADFDGDLFFTTDNKVLVDNVRPTLTLHCVQHRANKTLVTEQDLITANMLAFGDEIGSVTNMITSQIDKQADFDNDSIEFKLLDNRIKIGQLFQQNTIDKAKGIISKPIPKTWKLFKANRIQDEDSPEVVERKALYTRLIADKYPYFFIYNYSSLSAEYHQYYRVSDDKAHILFAKSLDEVLTNPNTDEQRQFAETYKKYLPVNMSPSVMNRICWQIENTVHVRRHAIPEFDYRILMSSPSVDVHCYDDINRVYVEYTKRMRECLQSKSKDKNIQRILIEKSFKEQCETICPNIQQLTDILITVCYRSESSKHIVWYMYGEQIIKNLLAKHDYKLTFPVRDSQGSIDFHGYRFNMCEVQVDAEKIDYEREVVCRTIVED